MALCALVYGPAISCSNFIELSVCRFRKGLRWISRSFLSRLTPPHTVCPCVDYLVSFTFFFWSLDFVFWVGCFVSFMCSWVRGYFHGFLMLDV